MSLFVLTQLVLLLACHLSIRAVASSSINQHQSASISINQHLARQGAHLAAVGRRRSTWRAERVGELARHQRRPDDAQHLAAQRHEKPPPWLAAWLCVTFRCAKQAARLPFDGAGSRPCCRRGPTSSPSLRRSPPKPPAAQTSVFGRDSGMQPAARGCTRGVHRPACLSAAPTSMHAADLLGRVGTIASERPGLARSLRTTCAEQQV